MKPIELLITVCQKLYPVLVRNIANGCRPNVNPGDEVDVLSGMYCFCAAKPQP